MSGETSVGVDPTPPVDPIPQPAPAQDPAPGLATEEPELSDEPDIPQDEPQSGTGGPTERQPGSGPR